MSSESFETAGVEECPEEGAETQLCKELHHSLSLPDGGCDPHVWCGEPGTTDFCTTRPPQP